MQSQQTFADELCSLLPVKPSTSSISPEDAPPPLNKEAVQVILDYAKEKASQGYGGFRFFLDGIYEQYCCLENTSRYYEESKVLDMLKAPEMGFSIEEEDTGDGTYVDLYWSQEHKRCYAPPKPVEVTPLDEIMSYLKSIKSF
jgi:hypothetical protein